MNFPSTLLFKHIYYIRGSQKNSPTESPHSHAPNREVAEAEEVRLQLRKVDEKDKRPGSAILRETLAEVSLGVLNPEKC